MLLKAARILRTKYGTTQNSASQREAQRTIWTFTYAKHIKEDANRKLNLGLVRYPSVAKVKPRDFEAYLTTELKLRSVNREADKESGVELLENISHEYDRWMVRDSQPMLMYYYRLEMLSQRVRYLDRLDMLPHEKCDHIRAQPPALMLTFDATDYDAPLVYFRGLVATDNQSSSTRADAATNPRRTTSDFVHMLYPICKRVTLDTTTTAARANELANALGLPLSGLLLLLMAMPTFYLHPALLRDLRYLCVHRFMMPMKFSTDRHTMHMFPPICNAATLGTDFVRRFCSHNATSDDVARFPLQQLDQVLDYNAFDSLSDYGPVTPECLSKFILRADIEELKDRTCGQKIKGLRGFNVPKRQY